jgi:hypothetical protein
MAVFALAAQASCGGDERTATEDVDTLSEADTTLTVLDLLGPSDAASSVNDVEVEVLLPPVDPVGFREPCVANSDCIDGWCVPSAEGAVCTRDCSAGCPDGWGCGRVLNSGTDQIQVCLDRAATLCHPCDVDDDCNLVTAEGAHRCVDRGAAGRFCATSCGPSDRCPEGFVCTDGDGAATEGDGHCQPVSGVCGCNALAASLELETTCYAESDLGRCDGGRRCGPEGLTACDAIAPVTETCNGVDDDCDGQTDEDVSTAVACDIVNAFGRCPGLTYCVAGSETCVGTTPVAEICDGLDQNCDGTVDEGLPDLDADGQADCMDLDDDSDGTVDGEDCDARNPQRSKSATEQCNGVDDDCDGTLDEENAVGCVTWFQDIDGDGKGSRLMPGRCLCAAASAAYYTVQNTEDCDDFDGAVHPGATEVCNGVDDSCNGTIDEGVQAPCGGCVNACLLKTGVGGDTAFAPTGANASGVTIDAQGRLKLAPGLASGHYRARWTGWPQGGTKWNVLFVDADVPDGATLWVRWRTAASEAQLGAAAFSASVGPFPPAFFPVYPEVTGKVLEVEIRLDTTSINTPLVNKISILGASL